MTTLADEGRALAREAGLTNADLGLRLMSFACRVARMEVTVDELVDAAMHDEQARANPPPGVLPFHRGYSE